MSEKNVSAWINILWSVIILFALSLWIYLNNKNSKGILGVELFPYIISPILIGGAIIVFILQRYRIVQKINFAYVFAGISNAYIGLLGVYFNMTSQVRKFSIIDLFFVVNIVIAISIIWNMIASHD